MLTVELARLEATRAVRSRSRARAERASALDIARLRGHAGREARKERVERGRRVQERMAGERVVREARGNSWKKAG